MLQKLTLIVSEICVILLLAGILFFVLPKHLEVNGELDFTVLAMTFMFAIVAIILQALQQDIDWKE